MYLGVISCLLSLTILGTEANLQSWSKRTYLHTKFVLTCNETFQNYTVSDDDTGVWQKLGQDGDLMTDANYELTNNNLHLVIKNVTDDTAGIYLCEIIDSSGVVVARSIKGVNINGPLYESTLDEYKTNIVRGIITTASLFVLVVGVCLIDRFRYISEEQKQKKRERKEEIRRRFNHKIGGKNNLALADDEDHVVPKSYGSVKHAEGSTHL